MATDTSRTQDAPTSSRDGSVLARRVMIRGQVQGVGFRPFVYNLASSLGLVGCVRNLCGEVEIHVQGERDALERFQKLLIEDAPPMARPSIARVDGSEVQRLEGFEISSSDASIGGDVHLPADRFLCETCLDELYDPANRRYRHPFITCTQCGPRYTLINALPYDRARTSMAAFGLCAACTAEYGNPGDRRFHAEPLSCPDCGPTLAFKSHATSPFSVRGSEAALAATVRTLRDGQVVAVRGIGGYHLICDAAIEQAIGTLRRRKRRPAKPLAIMFPLAGRDGLDHVRSSALLNEVTARALRDPARPIVIAPRRPGCGLAPGISPGLDTIGVFLPYSPLHALLTADFGAPLVATSANVSGEPVLTDPLDVEARLGNIADAFLHHDRHIVRHADDPVIHVVGGTARAIRLGRGTAPLECDLPRELQQPVLATGGHMKCAIGIGFGARAVLSPHIGELESPVARATFERLASDLPSLYGVSPAAIACDAHPAYHGTRWARARSIPVISVFHHHAHASAVAGEHAHIRRWLVFAWDGVGYGADGTLWGGEALLGSPGRWRRVASIRPFRPPGGDLAARQPWRSAAGAMWDAQLLFTPPLADKESAFVHMAWERAINAPSTSAIGRLFDAAACLVLGINETSFEGEAALRLEALATRASGARGVAPRLLSRWDGDGILRGDWSDLMAVMADPNGSPECKAHLFHRSLAAMLVDQACAIRDRLHDDSEAAFDAVGLTGGVFQNRLLSELVLEQLGSAGLRAYLPRQVPANDGGLAFGQIVEAAALMQAQAG